MTTDAGLRSRAVQVISSLVGLATDSEPFMRWARFLNLVPPSEDADVSGFIVEGVWKSLGVSHSALKFPANEGHAVFRLTEIAMDCGAWRCRPKDYMPLPGDVAITTDWKSLAGNIAYFVMEAMPGDPLRLRSVEGSAQGVRSAVRAWDGTKDTASGLSVLGWIDVTSLPIGVTRSAQ